MKSTGMKADLRREVTAWRLLVWAYADECVRAATNASFEPEPRGLKGGISWEKEVGCGSGGTIGGFLDAHMDAVIVDYFVKDWFRVRPMGYIFTTAAAERRVPPLPASGLETLRVVPVLNGRGLPQMLYTESGKRPYLCLIGWQGHSEADIRRHHEFHCLFLALLDALPGLGLSKWNVAGRGLTECGESLTSVGTVRSGVAMA